MDGVLKDCEMNVVLGSIYFEDFKTKTVKRKWKNIQWKFERKKKKK